MVAQLLGLKSAPKPDDAADGVAVALSHLIVASRETVFFRQLAGVR
jgi:Holliday junction resolvasome RuvABC endonuclease subunit